MHDDKSDMLETPAMLLTFLLLAVCAMLSITSAANLYQKTVQDGDAAFTDRTAVQFLQSKIRRSDIAGSVSVHDWDGANVTGTGPVLSLAESVEATEYRTDLYVKDGTLYEIFTIAGVRIDPENGEKIMALENAVFERVDGGIWMEITSGDNTARVFTAVRSCQADGTEGG